MAKYEPASMSKLKGIYFDGSVFNLRVHKACELAADTVKTTLITNLIYGNPEKDMEFMIEMANASFASLRSFQAEFRDLYGVVKDFIRYNCIASEATKELEKNILTQLDSNKSGYDWKGSFVTSFVAWHATKVELDKASLDLSRLGSRKASEEDLAREKQRVLTLQGTLAHLEKKFFLKHSGYIGSIVRKEMKEERFSTGYEDAIAGIERTKAELQDLLPPSD